VYKPSASFSPPSVQGLGQWPVPTSMNSTIYQNLFFLWAYHTKEAASALILLPADPHVQASLVCIFVMKTIRLISLDLS
jgi:uncharacterized membrane protein